MTRIPTTDMTHEQWIEARRGSIGGSDASAIVGLNPYMTQFELWASKRGMIPEKPENEAMRLGHDLEEYVARRFEEASGKRVRRENAILRNDVQTFAHANIDRRIVGELAGLECKTTSALNMRRFEGGNYPATYYVQCQHYMMVTGWPKWYLAVLILGRDFLWFEIERNEDDIAALAEAEAAFWQLVQDGKEPEADGSASCTEVLSQLYSRAEPETTADLTLLRKVLLERSETAEQLKQLQAQLTEMDNRIKQFLGETETGECDGYRVTWKNGSRTSIDTKRLRADHPEIFEAYQKTTTYRTYAVKEYKEDTE